MTDPYRIPASTVRTETVVSKSRFIATAGYASNPDEAKQFLETVRAEMPDASHHVYAFRVGHGNSVIEGVSDAGEPSGTSGPPILAILRGEDIGDIIVVVTRYFGGTKLGTGGLVRAYSEAARIVLNALETELKIEKVRLLMEFSYSHLEIIKRIVESFDGSITDEQFTVDVLLQVQLVADQLDDFTTAIRDATAGQCEPMII